MIELRGLLSSEKNIPHTKLFPSTLGKIAKNFCQVVIKCCQIFFHPSQSHFLFYKKISKSDIADVKETTAEDVRTGCYLVFVSPFFVLY